MQVDACVRTTMQLDALMFTIIIFMSLFTCLTELISLIILFVFKSFFVFLIILYKLSSHTMYGSIYY